jgi:multidrug efflux pump
LADTQLKALKAAIDKATIDPSVQLVYKGEDQEQKETGSFLAVAFTLAMLTMLAMMLMQFNSFYQSMIVMSAIALSTIGVLLGLLLTAQPFGIVMCGLGVIALAGIVVGNNIILIDTYNILRRRGLNPYEAVLRTCLQRMRPVLLTSATAVLGLLPMVFALTIDLFTPNITVGAPSTQWWTQLSSSIAGGITFATIMTLVFTPCLLILGERKRIKQEGSQPIELGQLG